MEHSKINAQKREITGKKTKKLRREGTLPGVVFSAGADSINIQFSEKEFRKTYQEAGHTTLVDVVLDGKTFKVIIDEVQYNPRTRTMDHVMLNKVNLKEEINAEVPIELIGESQAVKIEKAVIVSPISTLEIKCLPTDLPAKIAVDITALAAIGDSITVANLILPKGVKLVHDEDVELVLATATPPQKEEEVSETETTPEDVELSVKKGKEEEASGAE